MYWDLDIFDRNGKNSMCNKSLQALWQKKLAKTEGMRLRIEQKDTNATDANIPFSRMLRNVSRMFHRPLTLVFSFLWWLVNLWEINARQQKMLSLNMGLGMGQKNLYLFQFFLLQRDEIHCLNEIKNSFQKE